MCRRVEGNRGGRVDKPMGGGDSERWRPNESTWDRVSPPERWGLGEGGEGQSQGLGLGGGGGAIRGRSLCGEGCPGGGACWGKSSKRPQEDALKRMYLGCGAGHTQGRSLIEKVGAGGRPGELGHLMEVGRRIWGFISGLGGDSGGNWGVKNGCGNHFEI